jgi:hypothetical protein
MMESLKVEYLVIVSAKNSFCASEKSFNNLLMSNEDIGITNNNYEIENLMRKLITKFMLANVGLGWSSDNIPEEVRNRRSAVSELWMIFPGVFLLFVFSTSAVFKWKYGAVSIPTCFVKWLPPFRCHANALCC